MKTEIAEVPGVTDPACFNLLGQPNLVIRIDRAKAARYGFSVGDINSVVQAAIGGQEVTRVYEGEMNFALTVRLAPEYRRNVDAIRSIPVALPNSDPKAPTAYIALGDLGEVKLETGAAYIYRENSQRFVPLKYSVRGRDLGSTVAEAQERVAEKVPLPQGYRLEWTGEFGALVEAQKRLALHRAAQPAADLHAALQPVQFGARQPAGAVRHSVRGRRRHPRALRRRPEFQHLGRDRLHLAVRRLGDGWHPADVLHPPQHGRGHGHRGGASSPPAQTRMRQIFMTGLSACIGLVPAAISTGIGSQVQQPLACVIVGGMLLSPICSLLVIPTLARIFMPYVPGTVPATRRRLPVLSKRNSPRPPLRIVRAVGSQSLKPDRGHGCRPDWQ